MDQSGGAPWCARDARRGRSAGGGAKKTPAYVYFAFVFSPTACLSQARITVPGSASVTRFSFMFLTMNQSAAAHGTRTAAPSKRPSRRSASA